MTDLCELHLYGEKDSCPERWRAPRHWCSYCRDEADLLPTVPMPPTLPRYGDLPLFMRCRPNLRRGWRRLAALRDARDLTR